MNKIKLLGSGSSLGVPLIGCTCDVCRSKDPRNKRRRCSALLYANDKKFLIDAGPDIKQQLLDENISSIDGLIITHMHYDHVGGINDLLPLTEMGKKPLPILCLESTANLIRDFWSHIINYFTFEPLQEKFGRVEFRGESFNYTTYRQDVDVMGIRWETMAYFTDIKHYDLSLFDVCVGVRQLIINIGCEREIVSHIGLEKAVDIGKYMEAEKMYFTHLNHEVDYNNEKKLMDRYHVSNGHLAYDGLEITL